LYPAALNHHHPGSFNQLQTAPTQLCSINNRYLLSITTIFSQSQSPASTQLHLLTTSQHWLINSYNLLPSFAQSLPSSLASSDLPLLDHHLASLLD
jgi:hypothetical protein